MSDAIDQLMRGNLATSIVQFYGPIAFGAAVTIAMWLSIVNPVLSRLDDRAVVQTQALQGVADTLRTTSVTMSELVGRLERLEGRL